MTEIQNIIQKPFLKWVGGKTQIINEIIEKIPVEMNNYHELFLGGGSVLLAILSLRKEGFITIKKKIYAYDINEELINLYKSVQNNKDLLFIYIKYYLNEYDKINGTNLIKNPLSLEEAKSSKESYYYWVRNLYNSKGINTIETSALFIFLNKTCFRGLYRVGPNGFNVPYGHYKKTPTIISKSDLDIISELIQDVEFIHSGFDKSILKVNKGDFVYLDPPYAPENSNSFVSYDKNGFSLENHELLFKEIKKLVDIKFLMSNAKVDLVMNHFKEYKHQYIKVRRSINSKKPGSITTEVVIYN